GSSRFNWSVGGVTVRRWVHRRAGCPARCIACGPKVVPSVRQEPAVDLRFKGGLGRGVIRKAGVAGHRVVQVRYPRSKDQDKLRYCCDEDSKEDEIDYNTVSKYRELAIPQEYTNSSAAQAADSPPPFGVPLAIHVLHELLF